MTRNFIFPTLIGLACLFVSCAGTKSMQLSGIQSQGSCYTHFGQDKPNSSVPPPFHTISLDTQLINRFSPRSLQVAHAIGVLDSISEYMRRKKIAGHTPTVEQRLNGIEALLRMNKKIDIASLEISSIASKMDCEEERADQVAAFLQGKEEDAERKYVIASLVIGAAGTITSELLDRKVSTARAATTVAIGASVAEAALGVLLLLNKKKIIFQHERNVLADIWTGPETSDFFPVSVWYFLNYEWPGSDTLSLRKQLVERWLSFGQMADTKEKNKVSVQNLYFGKGGKYTADQLTNRADMYDQLEAAITLMKQDLKLLSVELEEVINSPMN